MSSLDTCLEDQKALEETQKDLSRKSYPDARPVMAQRPRHTLSFNCFFLELVDQEKVATTRRAKGVRAEDTLALYWEKGADIMVKPCHYLYDARVIEVRRWKLPAHQTDPAWADIYRETLLRDCWWPDTDSTEAHGWSSDEAYQFFLSHYGLDEELETIWFEALPPLVSLRERMLLKRLYHALLTGQERWQREQSRRESERGSAFFASDSMKPRRRPRMEGL